MLEYMGFTGRAGRRLHYFDKMDKSSAEGVENELKEKGYDANH